MKLFGLLALISMLLAYSAGGVPGAIIMTGVLLIVSVGLAIACSNKKRAGKSTARNTNNY